MSDTVPIQIKWPADLAARVRELAAQRRTTFSELVRQAVIDRYFLPSDDINLAKNGKNGVTSTSERGS